MVYSVNYNITFTPHSHVHIAQIVVLGVGGGLEPVEPFDLFEDARVTLLCRPVLGTNALQFSPSAIFFCFHLRADTKQMNSSTSLKNENQIMSL